MKSRIWEIKGGNYEKTIVKILVGPPFLYARCPEKCFTQIYVGAKPDYRAPAWRPE